MCIRELDFPRTPVRRCKQVVDAARIAVQRQRSLEMLWDIQKTGDIFFPKRWLDTTLGGYQTKDVADIVRAFLKGVPANYPDRLRNITLQSAEELYRAADLVRK